MTLPFEPPDVETRKVFDEIYAQTDRGCAVLAVSALDIRLRQVLEHKIGAARDSFKKVVGSDGKGMSFYEMSHLARCLEIVGDAGIGDLNRLGTIRNRFAHSVLVDSFDHPKVSGLCDELVSIQVSDEMICKQLPEMPGHSIPPPEERTRREKFQEIAYGLYLMMYLSVTDAPINLRLFAGIEYRETVQVKLKW